MSQIIIQSDDLPNGWVKANLGDLVYVITKGSTPTSYGFKFQNNGINFIKVESIKDDEIVPDLINQFINNKAHKNFKRSQLQEGDILFSIAGTIGRTTLVKKEILPANTNEALAIIRIPIEYLNPKYIQLILNSPKILEHSQKTARGGQMNNFSLGGLKKIELPIPPLNEQNRIVSKIQNLFNFVNATKKQIQVIQNDLKLLRRSMIQNTFDGNLTKNFRKQNNFTPISLESFKQKKEVDFEKIVQISLKNEEPKPRTPTCFKSKFNQPISYDLEFPSEWCLTTLNELSSIQTGSIQSGPFGSSLLHSEFQKTGFLVAGIDNVQDGHFVMGEEHRISQEKFNKLQKYQARPNDLLITVMSTVGRTCLFPENLEPSIITKHVYRITLDKAMCIPEYVLQCIRGSTLVQTYFYKKSRGGTRSGFNGSVIKMTPIPLPPIEEQKEIIKNLKNFDEVHYQTKKSCIEIEEQILNLKRSVLHESFTGKLVSQNPQDESAEILVKKIKKMLELIKN